MPAPSAVMSAPMLSLESILSSRARSMFRILPLSGSTAWKPRSRPCLADPPALSPSTMNNSAFSGSRAWQSASLPGSEAMEFFGSRISVRARLAASRAWAARCTFSTMIRASFGCSSSQASSASLMALSTAGRTSEETSLSLVWEENFGSGTLIESTQVRPSRTSSPESASLSRRVRPMRSP